MSGASALAAAKRRRSQPAAPIVKKPVARNNYRTTAVQKQRPVEKQEAQTYTDDAQNHAKESPMQLLLRHDSAIAELNKNQEILNENMIELHKALESAMDIRNIISDVIFKTDYIDSLKSRINKLEDIERTLANHSIMSAFKKNTLKPKNTNLLQEEMKEFGDSNMLHDLSQIDSTNPFTNNIQDLPSVNEIDNTSVSESESIREEPSLDTHDKKKEQDEKHDEGEKQDEQGEKQDEGEKQEEQGEKQDEGEKQEEQGEKQDEGEKQEEQGEKQDEGEKQEEQVEKQEEEGEKQDEQDEKQDEGETDKHDVDLNESNESNEKNNNEDSS